MTALSPYLTKAFWSGALERAVKTFAQVLAAGLVADDVLGVLDVDWTAGLSVAGLAAIVSVLTSVASAQLVGPTGSPSLVQDRFSDLLK